MPLLEYNDRGNMLLISTRSLSGRIPSSVDNNPKISLMTGVRGPLFLDGFL